MPKSNIKTIKQSRKIYLDYASGAEANPSAVHELGVLEKRKLDQARKMVADVLHGHSDEVIFTSGATESNNLALMGSVFHKIYAPTTASGTPRNRKFHESLRPHIVTSNIEHASVLEVCKHLEKIGLAEITYVEVEPSGIVDPKKVKKALRKDTVLVSVMYANNEIGTLQPIKEIAKDIRHFNKINGMQIYFHTDATQAINYLPINVLTLGVDMMTFNASKIYGPKGVGVLWKARRVPLRPIMFGGDQEFGLRPGTENVKGAVELAQALVAGEKIKEKEAARLAKLRDYFFEKLNSGMLKNWKISVNGDAKERLPNNVNITIPGIPCELLVIEFSARGIMISAKSACKSEDSSSSHVIEAINPNIADTDGPLRFSFGRDTNKKDIDKALRALSEILLKLEKWYN